MAIHDKIKETRKIKGFSQESMAEKLDISVSTYAGMENGTGKLDWDKLKEIARIFDIDIIQLIEADKKGLIIQQTVYFQEQGDNIESNNPTATYSDNAASSFEIEKRDLIIQHLHETISQQKREIAVLNELVESLKTQVNSKPA